MGTKHDTYQMFAFGGKKASKLAGLKVPSLAFECVLFRPEQNANGRSKELKFKGLERQKWNMTTDRAQRVDEKNGATYLSIMLTPRVMVIKMSKMAYFLYLLMRGKN